MGSNDAPNDGQRPLSFGNFTLGNGMLEIAALTALIGSSTAAYLALGNQGPVGLPWASLSAFGVLSVVRTCLVGATPDWLRETLGINTATSSATLGVALDLRRNMRGAAKAKREANDPKGIICKSNLGVDGKRLAQQSTSQDVYQFDQQLTVLLETIPSSGAGGPPMIFSYASDYHITHINTVWEWVALGSSVVKLAEAYAFWHRQAYNMSWVCCATWAYFFVAALFLMTVHWNETRIEKDPFGQIDILSGSLPSTLKVGGARKVFLGAKKNKQQTFAWRVVWAFGSVTSAVTLVLTYIYLSQYGNDEVLIWAGFQMLWLILRLVFHHFANFESLGRRRVITPMPPLSKLSDPLKHRLLDLGLGLARYQTLTHPRGAYSYYEDLLDIDKILALLAKTELGTYYIPSADMTGTTSIDLRITAIIGDTALSSVSWLHGSTMTGMDLYDTCVLFLQDGPNSYAIPTVRVLAGASLIKAPDVETGEVMGMKIPKGAWNIGYGIEWWYWIPCGRDGPWLVTHSEQMKTLGMRKAEFMTSAQVTRRLGFNDLQISLSHVDEIEATRKLAEKAAEILKSFLPTDERLNGPTAVSSPA